MFCTSVRSVLICCSSLRNAAASSSMVWLLICVSVGWLLRGCRVPVNIVANRCRLSHARAISDNARPFSLTTHMSATILDGKRIADQLLDELRARVQLRQKAGQAAPGLAVVFVGDDPASAIYVRNKRRACKHVGFRSRDYDLPATATQGELTALIDRLNADPEIHGILVQLPLPAHIDAPNLINRIDPRKDVDGFHPENIGRLALRQRGLRPCTSKGVMTLLANTDRPVRGQDAVIVGVSNHVGRPLGFELLLAGCTTTS